MSTTTYGPPVVLDGPLPVVPPVSLLRVEGVVKEAGDERWINGAQIWAYPTETPENWDLCYEGTFRDKAEGESNPIPLFSAYATYVPISCSAMGMGPWDEFMERAEAVMDAVTSFAVERALSRGVPLSATPFFADANATVLASGSAVAPMVGLGYLEDAIGATARGGMIHATPSVATQWFDQDRIDRLTPEEDSSSLVTVMGTPVAAGGGYIGSTPAGQAAAAAGQSWVYATGPVEVRLAELHLTEEISENLERSQNDVTYRAERAYLATWDTALQAAVLIDWSP